jgi:hypothetical protein
MMRNAAIPFELSRLAAIRPEVLAMLARVFYLPRRPLETVLHRLVTEHFRDFEDHAREAYQGPLPRYVTDEVSAYRACGDLDRGFVLTKCGACGHALLVGLSCKKRGMCPSCARDPPGLEDVRQFLLRPGRQRLRTPSKP